MRIQDADHNEVRVETNVTVCVAHLDGEDRECLIIDTIKDAFGSWVHVSETDEEGEPAGIADWVRADEIVVI